MSKTVLSNPRGVILVAVRFVRDWLVHQLSLFLCMKPTQLTKSKGGLSSLLLPNPQEAAFYFFLFVESKSALRVYARQRRRCWLV